MNRIKPILAGSISLLAIVAPAIAAAQTAEPSDRTAPAASSDAVVQDIVVTATRRSENLQNVPLAISALSTQQMTRSGVTSTTEIGNITPGLVVTTQSAALTPFIRGVGSTDASAGQETAVATFIDGVYIASGYGAVLSLNNIDRVEVLKGPQGTLFGRNATGGVINIVTRTPSQTPAADAAISYGNYKTVEGKFYGTTGISPDIAADVALEYHHQGDPYGINVTTGAENNRTVEFNARSKILITPTDLTRITLAGGYSRLQLHGMGTAKQFYPGVFGADGVTTYTGNYYDTTGNVNANSDAKVWDIAATVEQKFDIFTVKSITAYRKTRVLQPFDNDSTPQQITDVYIDAQRYHTLTQELQILSDPSSRIKWIVGGFYMNDRAGFGNPIGIGLFGTGVGLPNPLGVGIVNSIKTLTYSVFGEATVPLGSSTNITAGARYTSDHRELSGRTDILSDPVTRTVLNTILTPTRKATFNRPTYRLILDHHFTDAIMVYGSYSRGFKSGNFNTVSSTDPAVKPETLDAFEIGTKADLFDRRLRIDLAAYHYNYKDIQLATVKGPTVSTINAAKARMDGVELSGEVVVSHEFNMDFGASWMRGKILSFPDAPCYLPNGASGMCGKAPVSTCTLVAAAINESQYSCNLSGNRQPRTPKFTLNLSPTYSLQLDSGTYAASLSYSYNSGFFWDSTNTLKQNRYSLLNAQVKWTDTSGHFGARGFAKNLTQTKYAIFGLSQLNGDGFAAAPPRTYGIEISYKF